VVRQLGGHLGGLLAGAPHIVTAHSLEPMRPWKAEQLGGGYRVSRSPSGRHTKGAAAVIAVSAGMRQDILRSYPSLDPAKVAVVHNGIDSQLWQPIDDEDICRKHGMDPDRPAVIFVGRITRQKGLPYLMRAAALLPEDVQVVLCAGAPDTPEIQAEVEGLWPTLRASSRDGVVWIPEMLPRNEVVALLTASTVFRLPVGLRAPRHRQPRSDGLRIPGRRHRHRRHPEVVVPGETGWLVPIEQVQDGTGTPVDPDRFVSDLAGCPHRRGERPRAGPRDGAGRPRAR
jgi:starch synthase